MQRRDNLLSLCIITKNEEKKLPLCLKNIKDVVDEIVIVDTGSTDKTVKVAKQAGAKVYFKKWDNDFSEIRNYAIEKASGKWILFLDADETLSIDDSRKIKGLLNNPLVEGYLFYIRTQIENHLSTSVTQSLRLFRNRKEYRYQNLVYERIPEEIITNIKDVEITIIHQPDPDKYLQRQRMKIELLKKDIKLNPTDSYLRYTYGIELLNNNQIEEAIKQFQEAVKYVKHYHLYTPHLYKLLTWSLYITGKLELGIEIANKGLKYFPFYTDLVFLRGKIYQKLHKFSEAIDDFKRCHQLGDPPSSMVSEPGVGGYKALLAIGEIHEELLNAEKALDYYSQAFHSEPSLTEPLYLIGTLVKKYPQLGVIDKILLKYLGQSEHNQLMTLIDILCLEKEYQKALYYINILEAKANQNIMEDIAFVKGICYMMLERPLIAEKYFSTIPKEHSYYEQVLLKRIQNYWFHNKWDLAENLLKQILNSNNLNQKIKELYLDLHSLLTGKKITLNNLEIEGYQIIARLIENMLFLKQIDKATVLMEWLYKSSDENLWISIGELLATLKEISLIKKIYSQLNNKEVKVSFKEKVAMVLLKDGHNIEAEDILKLESSSNFGVEGHYLQNKFLLKKISTLINSALQSEKLTDEGQIKLYQLRESIKNEN
ncbi:hypothetical protein BHF71_02895 [Vulcanibacillus modesticaldus]|uniref:Glycosyltransferase 2-like domain-containing protein n=1 Tax=Vulcanibacillus modesticaldus TaxID=337097 RepID=A0A1D2YT87_9BACI|nr:hypothetical protein BHF71_02895 [Vulcanibacillus modesticaldus]